MVLLKVHIFSIWVRFFLLRSLLSPKIHHASPSASHAVGNLRTHSTGSRALHDLAGVRLSFSARLLQRSWLARWRAWFRANKLLPDRARRLPPPGRGGCGAGRIPAEPRAAGGGGAASPLRRDPDVPAAAAVAVRTADGGDGGCAPAGRAAHSAG